MDIRAYSNADDTFVVWRPTKFIPNCRGFALFRRRDGGTETAVNTWVGFAGQPHKDGEFRPSTQWPIQKLMWTDYLARMGETVAYRAVPVVRENGQLRLAEDLASPWTEMQNVTPDVGDGIAAYFNRGIVAAQWVARRLALDAPGGASPSTKLRQAISKPGDPLRNALGGVLREHLVEILDEAKREKLKVFAALYELDDPELLDRLKSLGRRANIVLANGSVKKIGGDQNNKARAELAQYARVYDRMVSPRALGHNKFLVTANSNDRAIAVWTGSTNWTRTGLCTQANNAILIRNTKLAGEFLHQWQLLRRAKSDFPEFLVKSNDQPRRIKLGATKTTTWFTRTSDEQDLDYARDLIRSAREGILFLMFNPGPRTTLLNAIIERRSEASEHYDPNLYVQGVVNQEPGTAENPVVLVHRGRAQPAGFSIILPAAVNEQLAYWNEEMKKLPGTFAMIHSKVIVIDPFGEKPVVITGSHNLGPRASGKNDENMVIIEGNASLAAAYAVNIISIYNQYRWRFWREQRGSGAPEYQGLQDDDRWLHKYIDGAAARENAFWMGA